MARPNYILSSKGKLRLMGSNVRRDIHSAHPNSRVTTTIWIFLIKRNLSEIVFR